jgi:thioredoxin 1
LRDARAEQTGTDQGHQAEIAAGEKKPDSTEQAAQDAHTGQSRERRTSVPEKRALSLEPLTLTDANFRRLTDEGVVLVDFWAPWCPWCRRLAPIIDKLAAEYAGKAVVAKLNTDENPETPARYAVRGLPTVIVLREGRLVAKLEGFRPEKRLRSALDAALAAK